MKRVLLSWSSGKDSAWALARLRGTAETEVVGLLTTLAEGDRRIPVHGVREAVLDAQAAAVGLPLHKVFLPAPCPNETYRSRLLAALAEHPGVTHLAFADLFLDDVRAFRETVLAHTAVEALFPLWGEDTAALAREMVAGGLAARVVSVDTEQLDGGFLGRPFDAAFLAALPPEVDPCGERGELHTFVTAAPGWEQPVAVRVAGTFREGRHLILDLAPDGWNGAGKRR